jgi:hypothetical protein
VFVSLPAAAAAAAALAAAFAAALVAALADMLADMFAAPAVPSIPVRVPALMFVAILAPTSVAALPAILSMKPALSMK